MQGKIILRPKNNFKQIVCVKEFHQSEAASWRQERSIISSPLYHSKFVVELLSSEIKSQNGKKKMWLVLPFYKNGDLQQFLKKECPFKIMSQI